MQLLRTVEAEATALVVTNKYLWYTVEDFELRRLRIDTAKEKTIVKEGTHCLRAIPVQRVEGW